jgi:hypothetical protein
VGRTAADVKRLAQLIPRHPVQQSAWKAMVCAWYAHGLPVVEAMARATEASRVDDPLFDARYESELIDL